MSFETVSFARMRASLATAEDSSSATPIVAVRSNQLRGDLGSTPDLEGAFAWAEAVGFNGAAGSQCLVPNPTRNGLAAVLMGVGGGSALDRVGALPTVLPTGVYRLTGPVFDELDQDAAALRWLLGAYRFERYRKDEREPARLVVADAETPLIIAAGVALTRDLVNTPANDMGPSQLEQAARDLATAFSAETSLVVGDELIDQNFPMIHAVGRAGPQAPRLIDLRWGAEDAPKVTLVGKGVCFDTGGLDLKPAAGMRNMKKDMGGAATVLGLASMIMASNLRVRLRVLIPA
ncbi:MAG: leucyl aminopeptidase family protein, partial [Pseudomonadota bacterium]